MSEETKYHRKEIYLHGRKNLSSVDTGSRGSTASVSCAGSGVAGAPLSLDAVGGSAAGSPNHDKMPFTEDSSPPHPSGPSEPACVTVPHD